MPVGEPTPIVIDRRARNVLATMVLLAVVALFFLAPAAARVAGGGIALAVVLSFPVRLLSRWLRRGVAIAVVMLLLLLAATVAVVVLVPLAVAQLTSLVEALPGLVEQANDEAQRFLVFLGQRGLLEDTPEQTLLNLQREALARAQAIGQQILSLVLSGFTSAFGVMLTLIGVIFVAVYLLSDTERIKRRIIRSFPLVYRDDAETLWNEAGESLSRYLTALLISSLFQGTASSVALYVLDVPYSLLLGIWTAIGAIVPYVGSYIGGVPAVIAAFFVSPLTALLTALTYFVINVIDGNLITPRVQGQAIRVHPVLVFLAVIAGGQIGGLWGALVAVPLLAIVRTIADFLDERLVVRDSDEPPTTISGQPVALPTTEPMLAAGADASSTPANSAVVRE